MVENGEVTALLDITKCLYDAIVRLEKVSEKGDAIAAAVQGVEVQYGNVISGIYEISLSFPRFYFKCIYRR